MNQKNSHKISLQEEEVNEFVIELSAFDDQESQQRKIKMINQIHSKLRKRIDKQFEKSKLQTYLYLDEINKEFCKNMKGQYGYKVDELELEISLINQFRRKENYILLEENIKQFLNNQFNDILPNTEAVQCSQQQTQMTEIICPLLHKQETIYKFYTVKRYRIHMLSFHDLIFDEYKCPSCDFQQSSRQDLIHHLKTKHHIIKCYCQIVFADYGLLNQHLKQCSSFFKSIKNIENIQLDQLEDILLDKPDEHEGICSLCQRKISYISFDRHMEKQHKMRLQEISCCICTKNCGTIENFIIHMRKQHALIRCVCQKYFRDFNKFKEHTIICTSHYIAIVEDVILIE